MGIRVEPLCIQKYPLFERTLNIRELLSLGRDAVYIMVQSAYIMGGKCLIGASQAVMAREGLVPQAGDEYVG